MANIISKTTLQILTSVNTPDYSVNPDWAVNPDLTGLYDWDTATELVPKKYWKYDSGVRFVEMSQAEKDVVDAALLPAAKTVKKAAIDARTGAIIAGGFDYDDHHFSLSAGAQMNLVGLQKGIDAGAITFPHKMSTDDDSIEYSIPDEATYTLIYLAAVGTVKTAMDSGRALKLAVVACTTLAEVEVVEDPR